MVPEGVLAIPGAEVDCSDMMEASMSSSRVASLRYCMISRGTNLSNGKSADQVMSIEDSRAGVEVLASAPKDLAAKGARALKSKCCGFDLGLNRSNQRDKFFMLGKHMSSNILHREAP